MAPSISSGAKMFIALSGIAVGAYTTARMTSDFQLVKFEPAESPFDENGNKKKFKVTFREMQPLELKPEAAQRIQNKLDAESTETKNSKTLDSKQIEELIQEVEQIIQEPTT